MRVGRERELADIRGNPQAIEPSEEIRVIALAPRHILSRYVDAQLGFASMRRLIRSGEQCAELDRIVAFLVEVAAPVVDRIIKAGVQ